MLALFFPSETETRKLSPPPDIEIASDKYKLRFASKTGRWFLEEQSSGLLSLLERWDSFTILDVGGGHGQYTRKLLDREYPVTILGGSADANKQVVDLVDSGSCRYIVGDSSHLPFPDNSFDIVISLRLMSHLPDWEKFIAETARVTRKAVVIDFPVLHSFNITYPLFFKLKCRLEGNSTRSFTVLDERKVVQLFQQAGFTVTGRHAQFFFPMVLHRVLNNTGLSKKIEKVCRTLTLTERFGSPVILRVEPDKERKSQSLA